MSTALINCAAVRKLALEVRAAHRPFWKADRVSKSFLERLNRAVAVEVTNSIRSHPTIGRTIK